MSEKLKKDTIELKFLRFFSKSTLIIMCVALMVMIPFSAIILLGIFVYLTIIKKKDIKIITNAKEKSVIPRNMSHGLQALADSFSIIGGVTIFFICLSFVTKQGNVVVDERSKINLVVLFIGMTIGRYIRYKRDSKKQDGYS